MRGSLTECSWAHEDLSAAAAELARRTRITGLLQDSAPAPGADIEQQCALMNIEAEPVHLRAQQIEDQLLASAPSLIALPSGDWLALLRARRGTLHLLTPALSVERVPAAAIRDVFFEHAGSSSAAEVEHVVSACAIGARSKALRIALLRERLERDPVGRLYELRPLPGASFAREAARAGLTRSGALFVLAHVAEYALWLVAWWLLARGVLEGRVDSGWLTGCVLILVSTIPVHVLGSWSQGVLAIGVGGLLKQRLLAGALRLDQDAMRRQGIGELIGRVLESHQIESLALNGALTGATALIELMIGGFILASGAGGSLHVALLAASLMILCWFGTRYWRARDAWTTLRIRATQRLVEVMNGHRTRLVQQRPSDWHTTEDHELSSYVAASELSDARHVRLLAFAPRGWLLLGIAGLGPAFVQGEATQASLALALGGVLLVFRAVQKLVAGTAQLAGAAISWRTVAPLFHAAANEEHPGAESPENAPDVVLDARDLCFQHAGAPAPVLQGAALRMERGDRVLLEGESGGGKSTFASLLAGLREPLSGLLLLGGLDRHSLGPKQWRKRIVAAPQYHENHILSAPFAFNLLMGRSWPPTERDLEHAQNVCWELGLGPLLQRMPGGMFQMVGDTGWQLSQGERSRVFIARALLQRGDLVILDESLAALDPETLRQCLECVFKRAPSLLVIAHP